MSSSPKNDSFASPARSRDISNIIAPSIPRSLHTFGQRLSIPRLPSLIDDLDLEPANTVETELPPVAEYDSVPASTSLPEGTTPRGSVANLANNMIGSGVLAMSFVFSTTGIGLGVLIMAIVCWLSNFSLKLMILNGKLARRYTYRQVVARSLGTTLSKIVDVCIPLYGFGLLCAYMRILGDYTYSLFNIIVVKLGFELNIDSFFSSRVFVLLVFVVLFVFPLCCLRTMESLSFSSLLALIGILVTVIGICTLFIRTLFQNGILHQFSQVKLFNFTPDVFRVIPIVSLAFSCHANILRMYQELHQRSVKRMFNVISGALLINFAFYFLCGTFGYVVFLSNTQSNLLLGYENGSFLMIISQVAMTIVISFSYPIVQFPVKKSITLFFNPKMAPKLHYPLTVIVFIASFAVSLVVEDLSIILGFTGSTVAVGICYILPPIMFLRLRKEDYGSIENNEDNNQANFGTIGCYVCLVLGISISVIGFARNLSALLSN
ncbi:hypothetical protein RCL1_001211 [Eukaryota sp. TZLM3-RCL]